MDSKAKSLRSTFHAPRSTLHSRLSTRLAAVVIALLVVSLSTPARAQQLWPWLPEQRTLDVRDPSALPLAPIPDIPPPLTVSDPQVYAAEIPLSLDDALRIALENSEVVRVLAGVQATSIGATIYDPAITNTIIDEQQARFDPTLQVLNTFNRLENPQATFDPLDPSRSLITGTRVDNYQLDVGLAKTTATGGTLEFGVRAEQDRFRPGVFPLNPQTRSATELAYTQPLLQGGGLAVNRVPIVLARINTERSYFQFKDAVQEMVRSVIDAYWALVFARVDVWARTQQVEQAQASFEQAQGRFQSGFANAAELAQTRLALSQFRAGLISARANLLDREMALRNLLGLPPADPSVFIPVTPPTTNRYYMDWNAILNLAQERRPDVVELKLVIEADEQLLLEARNQALPRLDAISLYRWNGLEGEMPSGESLSSDPGQFADWSLGVNFSVPLGLRRERSNLREQELIIMRDRANLQQGIHQMSHSLAASLRRLALAYEQYRAFGEAREAARINLDQQLAEYEVRRTIFLNVLQALTDWGNAVSSEAQALAQYNVELANLERETGTILESHEIRFYEERFRSLGPLGRLGHGRCYPAALVPEAGPGRYPTSEGPAEQMFLESPELRGS